MGGNVHYGVCDWGMARQGTCPNGFKTAGTHTIRSHRIHSLCSVFNHWEPNYLDVVDVNLFHAFIGIARYGSSFNLANLYRSRWQYDRFCDRVDEFLGQLFW